MMTSTLTWVRRHESEERSSFKPVDECGRQFMTSTLTWAKHDEHSHVQEG